MPRNGSGTYTLPEAAFVPGTVISSTEVNSDFSDIADALTNSLARDGQGGMLDVLPMDPLGFSYTNDPNTGMYRTAADEQAIKCGGTAIVTIGTTGVVVTGTLTPSDRFLAPAGTVLLPGYSFASDPNTGIYSIGADNIGIAANGSKVLDIGTAGLAVTGTLSSTGALTVTAGGLTITAGGATVTAGGLTVTAGTVSFPSDYYATQTQQEAASSTSAPTTPGTQKYHPGHPKGWVDFDSAGNIISSYNVTSVVMSPAGVYTITWTVPFSSSSYTGIANAGVISRIAAVTSKTANTMVVTVADLGGGIATGEASVVAFGDQ